MQYSEDQKLNEWCEMISEIYDGTQNYSKSPYEIHSHLTEVTGAFGKLLFKKKDLEGAKEFLPKMFVWALTLFRKVKGNTEEIEEAILIKFPTVCSYCLKSPCVCWRGEKPDVNEGLIREMYDKRCPPQSRRLNSFQTMFRKIYGESWGLDNNHEDNTELAMDALRLQFTRMIEELSEVAESIRFHHIYPSNFSNEMADYFAWWFAIVTNYNRLYSDGRDILLPEKMLFYAYPGYCKSCGLSPCDCRPGPVRELLSKPSMNKLEYIDPITQTENKKAFEENVNKISSGKIPSVLPITAISFEVDDFQELSNEFGMSVMKHISTVLRQKIRYSDRIYRMRDKSFSIMCHNFSDLEAEGMMKRVANALKEKSLKGKNASSEEVEKVFTLSIGISTCNDISKLFESFTQADAEALKSKTQGKDRIIRTQQ